MDYKLLLFDLDGTLLRSDRTLSEYTLLVLNMCRNKGLMIGVSTARSEQNSMIFLSELLPDISISSGGALIKRNGEYIYKAEIIVDETNYMIKKAREVCGIACEITIDTVENHYWNYKIDPKKEDKSWGDSIYTDFEDFSQSSLKMCVEIFDSNKAETLKNILSDYDCIRFSDGCWYKFTQKEATKEKAIKELCTTCDITLDEIIAFGDDFSDIGMLKLCGKGIAMENAIEEVKSIADEVIGSNDNDGIAKYLIKALNLQL
ncbi:MAG: Cof-type HAD-IIB family hydrolase [Clostridium sp.]|uniref:Cof-type HAD-IIB family hydrolase n=1 Tax=Clostridium sp. TaxID=1506 RepID=UPI003054B4A6